MTNLELPTSSTGRFFRFLDSSEESALLATAQERDVPAGHIILEQDAASGSIYLLDAGTVVIERSENGTPSPLAILGPGDIFGEMSFVSGDAVSARVVALEGVHLRILTQEGFERLRSTFRDFAARFYRSIAAILVERLRRTTHDLVTENQVL